VLNEFHLGLAVRALRAGGIVLHATEGVWGLACDPHNPQALIALLELKQRRSDKGLILIGGSITDFAQELAQLAPADRQAITASWPGPVTWLLPSGRFLPLVTGFRSTVAVRVPGHPQARALCQRFGGPLVSTSANISSRPAARNRFQAIRTFGRSVAFVLPGETLGRRGPSEIRLLAGDLVRAGA